MRVGEVCDESCAVHIVPANSPRMKSPYCFGSVLCDAVALCSCVSMVRADALLIHGVCFIVSRLVLVSYCATVAGVVFCKGYWF